MTISKLTSLFVLAVLSLMAVACSSDGENGAGDVSDGAEIIIVFPPNGLGDRSFNDNVLEGVYQIRQKHANNPSVSVRIVIPTSTDQLISYLQNGFTTRTKARQLLVLSGSSTADCLAAHPEWTKQEGDDILLLDSRLALEDAYTRFLSLYGVSHFSGQVLKVLGLNKAAVILANRYEQPIQEAAKGFAEGFRLQGGSFSDTSDVYVLSDKAGEGYDLADSLFHLSYTLDQQGYRFVYPLCGGSSQGLYRYTRHFLVMEKADPFYTCGVDVDQQEYSPHVGFSVVKRYDLLLQDFVDMWLAGKYQEQRQELGLESDYVAFVTADGVDLRDDIPQDRLDQIRTAAIEAERQLLNYKK